MIVWFIEHGWWLSGISAVLFFVGLAVGIVFLVLLPADYFAADRVPRVFAEACHPALRVALVVLKNCAGAVALAAGLLLALPLIPGPGVLFILVGLSLLDVPGKRALERYLIMRPLVRRPVNALRARWKRPPFSVGARGERAAGRPAGRTAPPPA